MKLNVMRADPAGNITLFVLDPVEKSKRGALAEKLMAIPEFRAEQVGYVCESTDGADGHMEMAGGEFCGNATRAFGMYVAKKNGLRGQCHLTLCVSGCEKQVGVDVDTIADTARAEMPLPLFVRREKVGNVEGTLVHLGGIAHFVVEDVKPSVEFFSEAEPMFEKLAGLDAYGVIFHDSKSHRMTPLVKVPAANSLVWEGSCGSGSLASAIAQSEGMDDGEFERDYIQPAGTVCATAVRKGGEVVTAYIGGSVTLDEPVEIEV
ncbi:MAG: hypothetical protein Q3995_02280 [Eubacteriales bacterium]|nr:hypothetical protein [Eubacteriales bacterium]